MDAIKTLTEGMIRPEPHHFHIGDTVKVHVRIKEGERQRIQIFEGTVIARKHGGISETFTVRRTSYGVGVERVFPTNSPNVEKVEIVRHGKVRRAKLYYLRDRVGKAAKVPEKIIRDSSGKSASKKAAMKALESVEQAEVIEIIENETVEAVDAAEQEEVVSAVEEAAQEEIAEATETDEQAEQE